MPWFFLTSVKFECELKLFSIGPYKFNLPKWNLLNNFDFNKTFSWNWQSKSKEVGAEILYCLSNFCDIILMFIFKNTYLNPCPLLITYLLFDACFVRFIYRQSVMMYEEGRLLHPHYLVCLYVLQADQFFVLITSR